MDLSVCSSVRSSDILSMLSEFTFCFHCYPWKISSRCILTQILNSGISYRACGVTKSSKNRIHMDRIALSNIHEEITCRVSTDGMSEKNNEKWKSYFLLKPNLTILPLYKECHKDCCSTHRKTSMNQILSSDDSRKCLFLHLSIDTDPFVASI